MYSLSTWWEGLIIEANIPVQEFEGQRGEGAYFRRGLIFGRIRYIEFRDSAHDCCIQMSRLPVTNRQTYPGDITVANNY